MPKRTEAEAQELFKQKTGHYYGNYKPPDPEKVLQANIMQGKELAPAESLYAQARGFIKPATTEKPTDYGKAIARIREGQGDKADSIHVKLLPGATQPEKPTEPTEYEKIRSRIHKGTADTADSIKVRLLPGATQEKDTNLTSLDDVGYKAEKDIGELDKMLTEMVIAVQDTAGTFTANKYYNARKERETIKKLLNIGAPDKESGFDLKKKIDKVWPIYQQKLKKSPVEANAWLMSEFDGAPLSKILEKINKLK